MGSPVGRFRRWQSRGGWFFIQFGGELYSFYLALGRFAVTVERP